MYHLCWILMNVIVGQYLFIVGRPKFVFSDTSEEATSL